MPLIRRRPILSVTCAVALGTVPALLGAQTAVRWQLSWQSDAYRYVDGQRVPLGRESYPLTVSRRGAKDSVLAVLETANAAISDTLDGVMSVTTLTLRSRPRGAIARPENGGPPAPAVSVETTLTLEITGDSLSGVLTRNITGIPGATVPPTRYVVTGRRQP
jgi:hypothetical protein